MLQGTRGGAGGAVRGIRESSRAVGLAKAALLSAALCAVVACAPTSGETVAGEVYSLPPAVAGATVAQVEVELPEKVRFVLRATVPLPKGIHGGSNGPVHLGVRQPDGSVAPAQIETVSRYPRTQDGADVVEVLARITRPLEAQVGTRVTYDVVVLQEPATPPTPPEDPLAALTNGPIDMSPDVVSLLGDAGNLVLSARDVFGHEYRLALLGPDTTRRRLKHGFHHAAAKVSGSLTPVSPQGGNQGTLSHLFGVQAYLGTWSGESMVSLDLRMHNGHDGHDKGTSLDDPVGKFYFDRLDLTLPAGYSLLQAEPDPLFGGTSNSDGKVRWNVVAPLAANKLHVFPLQAQFHRRLAVAPTAAVNRARELLDLSGVAFARRGYDAQGNKLYSWWNAGTARWFPQRYLLPSLEHVGNVTLRNQLSQKQAELAAAVQSGAGLGMYPLETAQLGWAHPWGISYGGMTGGVEINIVDGVQTMESASREGLRYAQLSHRLNSDRQPTALYGWDGEPSRVEDWLVNSGVPHLPFSFYMKLIGNIEPFGFAAAPTFQVSAATGQGRTPDYEPTLLSYAPHDLQHLIRYTRNAKVLAFALNDNLAKDDVLLQADLFRLGYHPYANTSLGNADGWGLRADMDFAEQWPGRGVTFGRGEAWGVDIAATAYSMADESWRQVTFPWFQQMVSMLRASMMPCSGHLMATVSSKMLDGKYRAAQSYEDSINHNALRGMLESVIRGQSAAHTAMLTDVLEGGTSAMVRPMQWLASPAGPKNIYGVGPTDVALGIWCSPSKQPADAFTPTINSFQTWCSLTYGYELTGSSLFLTRAAQMAGGDLLTELLGSGTLNIENRAPALALAQRLAGQL